MNEYRNNMTDLEEEKKEDDENVQLVQPIISTYLIIAFICTMYILIFKCRFGSWNF